MSRLEASEVTDAAGLERYERLNRVSPGGSVFSAPSWAEYQGQQHRVIGIYKGDELVGGSVVYEDGGRLLPIVPGTPWQGPVCRSDGEGERLAVAECLAQYLLRRYSDVSLTLPPDWPDVRGFLWAGMRSHVRYTYRGVGHVMRGRYEKRLRLRQFEPEAWQTEMLHYSDWQHWRITYHDSQVEILDDWSTRYYFKANPGGTWHAEVIDGLIEGSDRIFDMVGCNSPQRALFKRQFGGYLRPYYFVTTLDPVSIPEFWAPKEAKVA